MKTEEFTLTDLENSSYTNKQGVEFDLRDFINVTGYKIRYEIVEDVYVVNMEDVEYILG